VKDFSKDWEEVWDLGEEVKALVWVVVVAEAVVVIANNINLL